MVNKTVQTALLILLIMLLYCASSQAAVIRDDLLRIHAAIVPRIAMMDYDFEKKLVNKNIAITVLFSGHERLYAWRFQQYLKKKYPNGINGHLITTKLIPYSEFLKKKTPPPTTIFYIMPGPSKERRMAIKKINEDRLIFSYDPKGLELGAHISLHVRYRVNPVVNLESIKKSNITLRPAILKISDIFYQASR